LLGINKRGNPYLKRLFIHGARSIFKGWVSRCINWNSACIAMCQWSAEVHRLA
jgi:hypothetical protein